MQFMESMQLKYNTAAEKAGVHIVNACGYDSIPADLGIRHMIRNFKGNLLLFKVLKVECHFVVNQNLVLKLIS